MPFLCQGLLGKYICHQLCYPISVAIDLLAAEVRTVSNVFDENHIDVVRLDVFFQDTS